MGISRLQSVNSDLLGTAKMVEINSLANVSSSKLQALNITGKGILKSIHAVGQSTSSETHARILIDGVEMIADILLESSTSMIEDLLLDLPFKSSLLVELWVFSSGFPANEVVISYVLM